jgi:cytochrome P450
MIYSGKYQARDQRMLMLEYGPSLKTQRAAFADMLNPDSVLTYETLMEQEATKLVAEILAVPPASTSEGSASLKIQLNRYVASLVFTLTYGKKLADDKNLLAVQQVLDSVLLDAAPGAHLVDTFPILDRLPDFLSPWRKEARAKHDYESSMYIGLARSVRAEMLAGTAQECFATRLWGQHEKGVFSEETLAYVAGSAFEAALQSTSGTIMWLVMAMRKFPEAQARAQKEIDDLLLEEHGSTLELPTLEMLTRLPYCVALVKEVMRWQPVAPGAFPHCAMEDTEYKGELICLLVVGLADSRWGGEGMFIGKGTLVIANVLNIHRDPRNYVEPDAFRPERFMNSVDLSSNEVFTEGHYGFGFGRRLCPARYLGGKVVFIAAIRLLWAFEIQPVFDANGNSLPVNENHCPWTVVK